jgi:two-component system response regulator AtoC
MVRARTFREDLFYRLNVIPIVMPPLRARPEDIAPLVARFAAALGPANGKGAVTFEADALERLGRQDWPGNVRQLQNFVERLIVLADGAVIRRSDVERELARTAAIAGAAAAPVLPVSPAPHASPGSPATLDDHRRRAEREALREALERVQGNRTRAARILGVSRGTLYNMLAEHGLG